MTSAAAPMGHLEQELLNDIPVWLLKLRDEARQRFASQGYPTTRNEEWKYTNVAPITRVRFQPGSPKPGMRLAALAKEFTSSVDAASLVFINGHYHPELSSVGHLDSSAVPSGVRAESLRKAIQQGDTGITKHFGRTNTAQTPFAELNTASFEDGAFIYVPSGIVVQKPIHLVFLSGSEDTPSISHPRNLIVVGEGSQASFIETYAGSDGDQYFSNAVTEIVAEAGSIIDHYKFQREGLRGYHIAALLFQQGRNSTIVNHSFSFGGALVRNDVNAVLSEGAEATLNGLYVASGKQHIDNHTAISHAKPHAASHELYKGVLNGHASAVFNGKVIVEKDAQKTDAKQTNRNLLLSGDAVINTKPELQIYADDVRCTHGATIGQLDENALFYLRARGIDVEDARRILVHAFAREIIDRVKLNDLRAVLDEELDKRLRTETSEAV